MSKSEEAKAVKGLEVDVKYYARQYMRDGLSLEDLQQEGFMGALHGIRKWDESRGASLRTYASIWIHLYVKRAAQYEELPVSLDGSHQESSLYKDEPGSSKGHALYETVASPGKNPEEAYAEREPLQKALSCLTPQQLSVIRARFAEDGTCEDAGKAIGATTIQAHRLEHVALRKMRAS